MSLIIDQELLWDTESDIERIGQASALGALADDVLLELIQLEAGIKQPSELVVIPDTADLFRKLAVQLRSPKTFWSATSTTDALRRFTSETLSSTDETSAEKDHLPDWCSSLADQLTRLREVPTSEEVLRSLRKQFTSIAQVTLRTAVTAARPHHPFM